MATKSEEQQLREQLVVAAYGTKLPQRRTSEGTD
jgi:hypothetical protein